MSEKYLPSFVGRIQTLYISQCRVVTEQGRREPHIRTCWSQNLPIDASTVSRMSFTSRRDEIHIIYLLAEILDLDISKYNSLLARFSLKRVAKAFPHNTYKYTQLRI